jgi:hypothetical protein
VGQKVTQRSGGSTHIPGGHPLEGIEMGLLERGLHPLGLNKDIPTVAAMVVMTAAEPNGTSEILDR